MNIDTSTLGMVEASREFYALMSGEDFKWIPKAYELGTGRNPLKEYERIYRMVFMRKLQGWITMLMIAGFWILLYLHFGREIQASTTSFIVMFHADPGILTIMTIFCGMNLYFFYESWINGLNALTKSKWKTISFQDEVFVIIPPGFSYRNNECFKALVGTEKEIHYGDVPEKVIEAHIARLKQKVEEIRAMGNPKDATEKTALWNLKNWLKDFHAVGKKFTLCVNHRNEEITEIYSAFR